MDKGVIWGMTFANTRALLGDFSALEILVGRFGLAWAALWGCEACQRLSQSSAVRPPKAARRRRYAEMCSWRDEWLFVAMGFCGIFCYQFGLKVLVQVAVVAVEMRLC